MCGHAIDHRVEFVYPPVTSVEKCRGADLSTKCMESAFRVNASCVRVCVRACDCVYEMREYSLRTLS